MTTIAIKIGERFCVPTGVKIHQGTDKKYLFAEINQERELLGWYDDDGYFKDFANVKIVRVFVPENAQPGDLVRIAGERGEKNHHDFLTVVVKDENASAV